MYHKNAIRVPERTIRIMNNGSFSEKNIRKKGRRIKARLPSNKSNNSFELDKFKAGRKSIRNSR